MNRFRLPRHASALCLPFLALAFLQCQSSPSENEASSELVGPAEGTTLLYQDTVDFQWTGLGDGEAVTAYYRGTNGDTAWTPLQVASADGKTLKAVMPFIDGDTLTVRLKNSDGEHVDATYRVGHYHLLEAPAAGARFKRGDTVRIAWRSSDEVNETTIVLMSDGGKKMGYITGTQAVESSKREYLWVIGNPDEQEISYPAKDCRIVIHDYSHPEMSAESAGSFSID